MSDIASVLSGQSRYAVVCGDNREILPTLPDRCCDHVICDPPFEAEAHTKQRRSLKDATQKRGAANTGEVRRVDGTLPFAAIGHQERLDFAAQCGRIATRWTLAFCQIEAVGDWRSAFVAGKLEWVRGGIWRKPDGMPQFTGDRPGQGFEAIAIAHPKGRKRWSGGGKHGVWTFPLEHGHGGGGCNEHPTQKPLALMLQLILDFTDPDDVVIDPFCGSGRTLEAALRLGRRAIGIEREPRWAELSRERCEAELAGSTLQAQRAGQIPLFGNTDREQVARLGGKVA